MAKIYITFDEHYNLDEYNGFLQNLQESKIEYNEYVCMKPPFNFYFYLDEKYAPVFLKHTIAPKSLHRYMLERVTPMFPSEEFYLKRRLTGSPNNYEQLFSPQIFMDVKTLPYAILFRYKNREQLMKISKELGIRIWDLGKQREWNIAFSDNKFIKGYIPLDYVFLEKTKSTDYTAPGSFELEFNYKTLVKTKLTKKYMNYPYYDSGKFHPLQQAK